MARKCDADRILDMVRGDVRLRVLGRAAAMVWLDLVLLIKDHGADGVLAIGSASGLHFGSMHEIAFALRIEQTDLETQITQFVQRGLLQALDGATLALPVDLMPSARAIAARLNGRKGGRPPKNRTAEGQSSMLLPIAGGVGGKPMETQHETQDGAKPAAARPSLSLAPKSKNKLSLSVDEQNRIGRAAFDAAGFDIARDRGNWGIVSQWLADGADETLILTTIAAAIERGARPRHLGYFSAAIAEAIAKMPVAETDAFKAWDAADRAWWDGGKVGAQPQLEDFQARMAS